MLWMCLAAVSATATAAVVKHVARDLPLFEVVFLRLVFTVVPLAPWVARARWAAFATTRLPLYVLRSAITTVGLACYVFALTQVALATFMAIGFTRPLWVIVVAALALGEVVGWRRGVATLVGFAGVLLVVRPVEGLDAGMLAAFGDALAGAVTLVLVKRLGTTEPAGRIVLYYSLLGTLFTAVPAALVWQTPSAVQLFWLLLSAFAAAAMQYGIARACRVGEATVVAPVEYARLPVAALIGFVVFAEVPSLWIFAGTAVIFAATLYIAFRERRIEGPAPAAPATPRLRPRR
jgi:drug/metabolite transporter (DMT)-like permease